MDTTYNERLEACDVWKWLWRYLLGRVVKGAVSWICKENIVSSCTNINCSHWISASSIENDSCQLMSRKKRRGVIEKKRRDRINSSLSELKRLVPSAFEKQGSAKLEKAEILQLTVDHLKTLHSKGKIFDFCIFFHDAKNSWGSENYPTTCTSALEKILQQSHSNVLQGSQRTVSFLLLILMHSWVKSGKEEKEAFALSESHLRDVCGC